MAVHFHGCASLSGGKRNENAPAPVVPKHVVFWQVTHLLDPDCRSLFIRREPDFQTASSQPINVLSRGRIPHEALL